DVVVVAVGVLGLHEDVGAGLFPEQREGRAVFEAADLLAIGAKCDARDTDGFVDELGGFALRGLRDEIEHTADLTAAIDRGGRARRRGAGTRRPSGGGGRGRSGVGAVEHASAERAGTDGWEAARTSRGSESREQCLCQIGYNYVYGKVCDPHLRAITGRFLLP